ncbi:MAG: hypothetical protein A3H98_04050 [Bacteroidetes bacterium RIFCSPLOWO2_02_FULL_36_8]|nr:MAG: hypothetical protein A3H98_04050 [Bacteroidetes bacterium RIFCSPLOWO2_02_FULL_36_8]OFY68806.1 MAG: hypothetical protein A3G23_03175 [Bacteroidetes bacterium RIFCSPLOWO2_12_FULL_37_12]
MIFPFNHITIQPFNHSANRLIYLLLFLLTSCANIVPPTGGPKDETPPKLVHSKPTDEQRNYRDNTLELEFDEYVNTNNLSTNWIVSPPLKYPVETKVKKKKFFITLKDTLLSNTTYRFQFENSIVDNTEKNPPDELTLTFSTGEIIDTGIVKGMISEVLSGNPVHGITVGLIPAKDSDTVHFVKKTPLFLTRSTKTGEFQLKNLPQGQFNVIAFDDKNKNYTCDISSERVAFTDSLISIRQDTIKLNLHLYKEDHLPPYILKSQADEKNKITLQFSEGVDSISLFQLNDSASSPVPFIPLYDGKNLVAFPTIEKDSVSLHVTAIDSSYNKMQDTLFIGVKPDAKKDSVPFVISVFPSNGTLIMNSNQIKFLFRVPVIGKTIPLLEFMVDSVKTILLNKEDEYAWNKYGNELSIKRNIPFTKNLRISIPDSMFSDVYGLKNRKEPFIYYKDNDAGYGALSGTVNTIWKNFTLDLLDDKGRVLRQLKNNHTFRFEWLKPGKYVFRLLEDRNNNERWDRGDIFKNILPEKIFYYKNIMPLKANWEIENIEVNVE